MAKSWQSALITYRLAPTFHQHYFKIPSSPTFSHFQSFPLFADTASLTNECDAIYTLCSLACAPTRAVTLWPGPNDQSHRNNYGMCWHPARLILCSLPITSLGAQRDALLVPKNQNKLGSCPKESREGALLAQCAHMHARMHTRTNTHTQERLTFTLPAWCGLETNTDIRFATAKR